MRWVLNGVPVGDVSGNGLFRAQDLRVPGGSLSVGSAGGSRPPACRGSP
ncbi:hypothetical protein ACNPQM_06175 [Streptomyces sp. NPDC056231]